MLIRLTNITKSYRLGKVNVRALDGIDLDVARGDFLALAGPSGSGKTTLLNLVGCIDKPNAGRIVIDDVDVTAVPLHRLAATRRDALGFIFQTFNLIPVLTAYENVEYPLLLKNVGRRERDARVRRWLDQVGIAAQAKQRPDQLSGGQRQRVAIARALLAKLNSETGTTFVFATHDPAVMSRAHRCVRLRDGRIAEEARALVA